MLGLGLSVYKSKISSTGGGSGPSSGYTPPLDSVTAAVAYSVRKLNSTYTGDCMLVRRVSDGATQDIGFDSDGLIDVAALTSFSGGSELTVKVWYDQSGGGFDLEQPNDAYLPTIYDGSAVTTSTSGKPCVRIVRAATSGPGEWLITDPVSLSTAGDMDVFLVLHGPFASGGDRYFWNSQAGPTTSGARWGIAYNTNTYVQQPSPVTSIQFNSLPIPNNLQFILNAQYNASGNTNTLEGNATVFGTATSSTTYRTDPYNVTLGARVGGAEGYNSFDISEIIHLPTYDATENVSLGANINSYYEFTNWSATSGFLADYPDAAAAYSVRQLSNNAIKCMRVRRAAPPYDEQDIGFTAGGDLDEASIVAFGGSDELRVSAWYDQSGQSNHARQTSPTEQPQIYDGTAVIIQDGKPALDYNGAQFLSLMTEIYDASMSVFCVWKCDSDAISNDDGIYSFSDTDRFALQANRYAVNQLATRHTGATSIGGTTTTTDQNLTSHLRTGSTATLHANGSALTTSVSNANTGGGDRKIGMSGSAFLNGYVWELVAYIGTNDGDQSSNRTAIETNINSYFQIYP